MELKIMGSFLQKLTKKQAISLPPHGIYFRNEKILNDTWLVNNKKIRWIQQVETFYIFYYIWYGIEWCIKRILPPYNKGVCNRISFEKEVNHFDKYFGYLETRKKFAWVKYIFISPKY